MDPECRVRFNLPDEEDPEVSAYVSECCGMRAGFKPPKSTWVSNLSAKRKRSGSAVTGKGGIRSGSTQFVKGVIEARDPATSPEIEKIKAKLLSDYGNDVLSGKWVPNPPTCVENGEAEIHLKPGAKPVKQRAFQMAGERNDAWVRLTDELIADGKIEPGVGP
jgi:hypothetical protein